MNSTIGLRQRKASSGLHWLGPLGSRNPRGFWRVIAAFTPIILPSNLQPCAYSFVHQKGPRSSQVIFHRASSHVGIISIAYYDQDSCTWKSKPKLLVELESRNKWEAILEKLILFKPGDTIKEFAGTTICVSGKTTTLGETVIIMPYNKYKESKAAFHQILVSSGAMTICPNDKDLVTKFSIGIRKLFDMLMELRNVRPKIN